MGVIDQINALGVKVGDTIEGTQSGRITGSTTNWWTTTRLTLIWQGSEVAVWRETTNSWRMPAGEWTPPRESASWSLDCRDWRIIDVGQA